jgi:cytidylate kinase
MPIVTISKGSFSHGEQVAEIVSERLGFASLSRDSLLEESATEYNVPAAVLVRAAYDPPSFWDRVSGGKDEFVAYVRAALLRHLCEDNVVYHGLAGQYFVEGVAHILTVRIIASCAERAAIVMERDGVDEATAMTSIKNDDAERRSWSAHLYGLEVADASIYDLVLNVDKLSVEEAADIICTTVALDRFKTTPESQQRLADLALAAQIKASLVDIKPRARVQSSDGDVVISVREKVVRVDAVAARLKRRASAIPGVKSVRVDTEVAAKTPF